MSILGIFNLCTLFVLLKLFVSLPLDGSLEPWTPCYSAT